MSKQKNTENTENTENNVVKVDLSKVQDIKVRGNWVIKGAAKFGDKKKHLHLPLYLSDKPEIVEPLEKFIGYVMACENISREDVLKFSLLFLQENYHNHGPEEREIDESYRILLAQEELDAHDRKMDVIKRAHERMGDDELNTWAQEKGIDISEYLSLNYRFESKTKPPLSEHELLAQILEIAGGPVSVKNIKERMTQITGTDFINNPENWERIKQIAKYRNYSGGKKGFWAINGQ